MEWATWWLKEVQKSSNEQCQMSYVIMNCSNIYCLSAALDKKICNTCGIEKCEQKIPEKLHFILSCHKNLQRLFFIWMNVQMYTKLSLSTFLGQAYSRRYDAAGSPSLGH